MDPNTIEGQVQILQGGGQLINTSDDSQSLWGLQGIWSRTLTSAEAQAIIQAAGGDEVFEIQVHQASFMTIKFYRLK